MTRAKSLLVVIGNGNILALDETWRHWLQFVYANGCISGLTQDLVKNIKASYEGDDSESECESEDDLVVVAESGWREME
jgi:superfamily I DNA and/or RNA helicase